MKTKTKIQRSIKTRSKILQASRQLQSSGKFNICTDFGLGIQNEIKPRQRTRKIKEGKKRLLDAEEQFEAVCEWLGSIKTTEKINTANSSYYLKHLAENRQGVGHISNGSFICAAVYCGFRYKKASGPNLVFNMSNESIHEAYLESLNYQKYPLNADLSNGGLMN